MKKCGGRIFLGDVVFVRDEIRLEGENAKLDLLRAVRLGVAITTFHDNNSGANKGP